MLKEKEGVEISVVVPLFNEEESLRHLYASIVSVIDVLDTRAEILFIDDGSTDRTPEILDELRGQDERVRVVRFRRNYGQTPAMAAGFEYAKGDLIITMDGDLQNDPADIPRLLKKLKEGYDIVSGWRYHRKDTFFTRRLPSMVANAMISLLSGVRLHDYGCSLKVYRSKVLKNLTIYAEMHRFIPAMAALTGAKTAELAVNHRAREYGKSKYGISRVGKVFIDMITVQMLIKFSSKPVHWFGMVSLPFVLLGLFFGIWSLYLYAHHTIGDFSIVVPGVCFLLFYLVFHLVSLGLLSELILKTGEFSQGVLSRATEVDL